MVKITIGFAIITIVGLALTYNHNYDCKILVNKGGDSAKGFVFFTIDSATAVDYKKTALSFYYHDSLSFGRPVAIAGTESKLSLIAPTLLFEANASQTPFLIFPGENIIIKYAGSDSLKMYVEDSQQRTNELDFFKRLVQKTGNIYYGFKPVPYLKKVNTLTALESAEKLINAIKNDRLNFLKIYATKFPISNSFIEIASNSINSKAFNDSILLYYNSQELLNKLNIYKKLLSKKLTTFKNIRFEPYQIYYRACITFLSVITTNSTYATIDSDRDFITVFNFSDKNFSGLTREFLLANTIYKAYSNTLDIANKYLDTFNTLCKNEGYRKIILQKLNQKNADRYIAGNDILLFADGKTNQNIQKVISKFKGKIILLDFWASWCFPCRAEMPFFDLLRKQYENKQIAFLTISSDRSVDDWLRAVKEESMENDNSFLLLNFDRSLFAKQYNIYTIPRYILINKVGELINDDTPRPSDPKLKELIDKNL